MEYTDNPRKIYGRVEIIYSDAEISKDIVATVSANSTISHPDEVHEPHLTPTVKACTMDGNSTMDGSFQMIDDSCFCGWWSGALADANGNFANPPWLELTFVQRPIISWLIIGDDKLGQYPVNFKVEYKNNGTVVRTETKTNNTSMQVRLTPYVEDITSIRITITKWSKGNACVKLLKFYDRLAEMYEGDAIQMFEVNEEMSSAEGNYNINSDTMSVSVYNADRKFDRGYLRSLMILDRKLKPSLVHNTASFQYEEFMLISFYQTFSLKSIRFFSLHQPSAKDAFWCPLRSVAGVGFFIALPSRIVVRLRRNRHALPPSPFWLHALKKDTPCPFFYAYPPLCRRVAAAGGRGENPVLRATKEQTTRVGGLFFCWVV